MKKKLVDRKVSLRIIKIDKIKIKKEKVFFKK